MPRESMNITEEQYAEMRERMGMTGIDLYRRDSHAPLLPDPLGMPRLEAVTFDPNQPKRKRPGIRMNRWEAEYALELAARKQAGEVLWWGFESIKLRLADATYYTPDFAIAEWSPRSQLEYRLKFVEIKGHLRDDAAVKFKVAAEQFPCFEFVMLRKRKGGGWDTIRRLGGAL